jgi:hypothetical protein
MIKEDLEAWKKAKLFYEKLADMPLELDGILFLIGIQELGQGMKDFSKDEKMDLVHLAVCTILEPYGYYVYTATDSDGWPHYQRTDKLPFLKGMEQERLMREAIVNYTTAQQLS